MRDRGWLGVPQNFACGEGWGFRLLTAFAAEWWGSPEGAEGDGRRREESANAEVLPAAAHTYPLHTSRQGRKPGRKMWHTANRMSRRDDTIECSLAALLGLQGLVG